MIKVYRLRSACKRGTLKIKPNVPFSQMEKYLYPYMKERCPDDIIFKGMSGKKCYDMIHYHEAESHKFLSQKFIDVLSQSVDMEDKCYPIKIEGMDEHYYILYNLDTYRFLNKDEALLYNKEPCFFCGSRISSPLFCISNTHINIVTEDIKNNLIKDGISNIKFEECFVCTEEEYEDWKKAQIKE